MIFPCFLFLILFIFNQTHANEHIISSSNRNCTVIYDKQILYEGDSIMIITKLYKVEGCQLQRAYHACGTHLWVVINIVCEAIEVHKGNSKNHHHQRRLRRFTRENLLTEACCLSTCTINEMTRYCP